MRVVRSQTARGFRAVSGPMAVPSPPVAGTIGARPPRRAPVRRWRSLAASSVAHLSFLAAAVLIGSQYVPPDPASEGSPFQLVFAAPTPKPPPVPAPPRPVPPTAVAPPPPAQQAPATPDVPQVAPPPPAELAATPDVPAPPVPAPAPTIPRLAEVAIPKPEPHRPAPAPPRHAAPERRVAAAHAVPHRPAAPAPTAAAEAAPSVPAAQAVAQAAPLVPARPLSGMASDAPPVYPELARRRGEQGRVLLRVNVSADGQPVQVAVAQTSGFPALDQAARDAVRRWRFVPATQAGIPIAAVADVRIRFRLEE